MVFVSVCNEKFYIFSGFFETALSANITDTFYKKSVWCSLSKCSNICSCIQNSQTNTFCHCLYNYSIYCKKYKMSVQYISYDILYTFTSKFGNFHYNWNSDWFGEWFVEALVNVSASITLNEILKIPACWLKRTNSIF